jgi:TPP-dependent indolepyruvate ferredoxin oxidoreductase alpha subunit
MREKGARNTRKKMKIEEVQRKNGYKTVRIVTTFPMKEADTIL